MLKSVKLHDIGPVQNLSARFGERLNILTGDNGLGKSFLLDIAFWTLTGSWPGFRVALPENSRSKARPVIEYHLDGKPGLLGEAKTALFDYHTQAWKRPDRDPATAGLVIYAAMDGIFCVWDPLRNNVAENIKGKPKLLPRSRAFQFDHSTLAFGLSENERMLCNGLVQDWVDWYYQRSSQKAASPFELLEDVIGVIAHPEEPMKPGSPPRVFVDDARKYPTLDMPYGNVPFPQWAAGIRRIISLAYLLVWSWFEHTQAAELQHEKPVDRLIFIIDE